MISVVDLHRRGELRSLRYHSVIGRRLAVEPELLMRARTRVQAWLRDGSVARDYALAWEGALSQPVQDIEALLTDTSERANALRQVSPFAGALHPRERWRLWAAEGS
jgi:hypothetical protein